MERKPNRHSNILRWTAVALGLAAAVAFSTSVVAQTRFTIEDIGSTVGLGTADLKETIINVIRWVLGILALVAVSFIMYGGYLWLTAAGNVERIQKAKRVILNAVIGLVIVLISWAIVSFVAKTFLKVSSGGPGPKPPICFPGSPDPQCAIGTVGFEIRSITTDCQNADLGDYRHKVFLCSAINVTFNRAVNGATVQNAVETATPKLVVEKCDDADPANPDNEPACNLLSIAPDGALDGYPGDPVKNEQRFTDAAPSRAGAEWVARLNNTGKSMTFFHVPTLFEKDSWYRVTIPKSIEDVLGRKISACRKNVADPGIDGCIDQGNAYTWNMQTGTEVDTTAPQVSSAYPDVRYLLEPGKGYTPDQNVPRSPLINLMYDQAILAPTQVQIIAFSTPPDPVTGQGGALGSAVNQTDYTVTAGDDGRSVLMTVKTDKPLEKFTWYKVVVAGVLDLCSNAQSPEPFEWVFETNDVVADIADHYPRNGTGLDGSPGACEDTPVFIRYTVSMYDPATGNCQVNPDPTVGSYVTAGYLSPDPAVGTKALNVDPSSDPAYRCNNLAPGERCPYEQLCKMYSFKPEAPDSVLKVNTTYKVGVDNRYQINDAGDTLRFGEGLPAGPPSRGDWHFGVAPAGQCVNRPVITRIDPPEGTDGQCLTVQGYGFDPEKNGRAGGDDLLYDGATQPDLAWSDQVITTEAPGGPPADAALDPGPHLYQVKAQFPAPFGILESNQFPWTKKNGPDSNGPCLISLEPNAGFRGSDFKAKGKRFNPASTTKKINFSGASNPSFNQWKDNEITSIVVPADAVDGLHDVSVENDAGRSNELPYTVKPIPPDQPIVISRWPSCSTSCSNADIGAQFSVDVEPASLGAAGALALKACDNENCNSFSGGLVAMNVVYDGAPSFIVHILPQASLAPGQWFRVVLKNSIKGSTPPSNGNLGGLNYDDNGDGTNDAYSWIFRTAAAGAQGCALNRVTVKPNTATMRRINETKPYSAEAYTEPNECSASGQLINPTTLGWDWTADVNYATVAKNPPPNPPDDDWNAIVTAKNETVPNTTEICSQATDSGRGITKNGCGTLTIDLSFCEDDTDCEAGGLCIGSICDQATHRCSPLIKNIQPVRGEIGTWVQINGCYFGNYVRGTCQGGTDDGKACDVNPDCSSQNCQGGSAVIFTNNKRGRWPNPPLCGAPSTQWGQSSILSEVPDRDNASLNAIDGPLAVHRQDGQVSNASSGFTVDPLVKVPGICKISPRGGAEGTDVKLFGQNFGTRDPTDKVMFYREHDASCVGTWTETEAMCRAPNGIENNPGVPPYEFPAGKAWEKNEVALLADSQWSNVVNFDVTPPGCLVCGADSECSAPAPVCGYGKGGASGCCVAKPMVTDTNPTDGQINVCRNSIATATFDRAMDGNTITTSSVHLQTEQLIVLPGGGRGVAFRDVLGYGVRYDAPSRTVSISPPGGLFEKNTRYKVVLSSGGVIRSSEGGGLDQFEWTFTSADTDGPCKLTRCEVAPSTWIFPKVASKTFSVRALTDGKAVLSEVPGVYEWEWEWNMIKPPDIADFNPVPGDTDTASVDSKPVKGNTVVVAKAKPTSPAQGLTTPVLCSASIKSTACEKPWLFQDGVGNCSLVEAGASCTDFHFKMDYCLDDGLPNLNFDGGSYQYTVTATRGREENAYLLKEYLFKELDPNSRDAIGIRIYDNTEGLSAPEWYNKFAPNPASPSSLAVDGYDAIKDGTTVYVAATNYDGSNFQNLIFLISYNQGAAEKIVTIYRQLLESVFFNTNVTTMCNGVESHKVCVQRDLLRLAALKDTLEYLRAYKTKNGTYPKLESGSYLPQLSFSVWPSWQQTLGNELGKRLTLDPKNKIVNCPPSQAQDGTCWNETDKKFICPSTGVCVGGQLDGNLCSSFTDCDSGVCEKSHILGYQADPSGANVTLYANLEYDGSGWVRPPSGRLCSSPSDCQCFNYYVNP